MKTSVNICDFSVITTDIYAQKVEIFVDLEGLVSVVYDEPGIDHVEYSNIRLEYKDEYDLPSDTIKLFRFEDLADYLAHINRRYVMQQCEQELIDRGVNELRNQPKDEY